MAKLSDTIANYLDLRRKIQGKQYAPVYLLHGEEVYFIDAPVTRITFSDSSFSVANILPMFNNLAST